jgi:hypothetical protein
MLKFKQEELEKAAIIQIVMTAHHLRKARYKKILPRKLRFKLEAEQRHLIIM